jgi:hypothetical protein
MAKSYLHKQTIVIAIVCFLAVAGTAGYVYSQKGDVPDQNVVVEQAPQTQDQVISTSTDWKKQFFQGNSAIGTRIASSSSTSAADDQPLTLTDKVGRDFFARYFELKQNGLDSNDQLVQGVIDQTIANAQTQGNQSKEYTLKDIKISADTSTSALHAYGDMVAAIMNSYGPKANPADIAYSAFDQNDMTVLRQIDPITAGFKKVAQTLLLVPVPQPLENDHLALINEMNALASISGDLRNLEGDPMQSLVSLSSYGNAQTAVVSALYDMQTYFAANNITFATTEAGALFPLIKQ